MTRLAVAQLELHPGALDDSRSCRSLRYRTLHLDRRTDGYAELLGYTG